MNIEPAVAADWVLCAQAVLLILFMVYRVVSTKKMSFFQMVPVLALIVFVPRAMAWVVLHF